MMNRTLKLERYFTREIYAKGLSPYEAVEWEKRTASLSNAKGEVIFEQKDVEVPAFWSQTATNIVANKYFHGKLGTPERETSVRQVVGRIAGTEAQRGFEQGYFDAGTSIVFK